MSKRLFLAVTLISLGVLCSSAVAQEHGPPAGGSDKNLREAASDLKGRSVEMERVSREAKKPDKEKSATAQPANFAEIKEDFERIQIVNNDVLQPANESATIDYQRVLESAQEIEKRAARLRTNLFGVRREKQAKDKKPSVESEDSKPTAETQDLKSLVVGLDNSINSFARSPMFQNTQVVTPEDSLAAQKELDKIIKISGDLRIEADRVKKTHSPPNQ
jgi:hypothetical protein